jgi:hypothetical protein
MGGCSSKPAPRSAESEAADASKLFELDPTPRPSLSPKKSRGTASSGSMPRPPSPTALSSMLLSNRDAHSTSLRASEADFVSLRINEAVDADEVIRKVSRGDFRVGRGGTAAALVAPRMGRTKAIEPGTELTIEAIQLDHAIQNEPILRQRFLSLLATRARFGLLLICGDALGLAAWAQSASAKADMVDVPDGRLFVLLEDGVIVALPRLGSSPSSPTASVSSTGSSSSTRHAEKGRGPSPSKPSPSKLSPSKRSPTKPSPTKLFAPSASASPDDDAVWTVQEGHGSCIWLSEGHCYVGQFANDMANGRGVFTWASGTTYSGEFVDELQHGKGTKRWTNGDTYEGEWRDDLSHGHGTYTFANGAVYTGGVEYGKRSGDGMFTYSNGDEYVGSLADDERHGFGTMSYAKGNEHGFAMYTGEWCRDIKEGHGEMTWVDGSNYMGQARCAATPASIQTRCLQTSTMRLLAALCTLTECLTLASSRPRHHASLCTT